MLERRYIERAVQIVATRPFEFLLGGLLSVFLTLVSAGLLAGPAFGGIVAMALKRCRNEEIDTADLFRGFESFSSTFVVGVAVGGMILFGSVLLLVPGILLAGLFGFALPIAIDRSLPAGEALKQARVLATKDLIAHSILMAVLGLAAISGIVFMVVGLCVSVPIALTALTLAYYDESYPQPTAPGASED
jgi:uncharacterized membrane protein